MVHEISPQRFYPEYNKKSMPKPDSSVFVFSDGKVLCRLDSESILHTLCYSDVCNYSANHSPKVQYLFSIDSQAYFLAETPLDTIPLDYDFQSVSIFRQGKNHAECFAGLTAHHLWLWYQKNIFCGHCGARMLKDEKERAMRCSACGNLVFPRISPAIIVGVINQDRLLLTKYYARAYTRYALIAGYMEIGETPEDTVRREVMEEVGVKIKNIRYYKSQPWGFDGNVLLGYWAELDGSDQITLEEDELSVAKWCTVEDMHKEGLQDDGVTLTWEMVHCFMDGRC